MTLCPKEDPGVHSFQMQISSVYAALSLEIRRFSRFSAENFSFRHHAPATRTSRRRTAAFAVAGIP
eukprot:scaffold310_cov307-Pinguiococcus_pyrenoidosus.AAC.6